MFCKEDALKNLATFIGKPLWQSLFFNKIVAYKETPAEVFSFEYWEIFKITFFIEYLRWLPVVKLEPSL